MTGQEARRSRAGRLRLRRRRDVLVVVTAVVLLLLGSVSAWAVTALSSSTGSVIATTKSVRAFQDLQEAVASQAFAEAGYRRAPSPAAQLRLDATVADVDREVAALRLVTDPGQGAMLSYLQLLNDRYVAETRRALDEMDRAGNSGDAPLDDRVAGPALDAVQQLVSVAIAEEQEDMANAVERQRRLVTALAVVLPVVLLIAAAALTIAVRTQRAESVELERAAADAHRRATHDPLTGLGNRAQFDAALADALARDSDAGGRQGLLLIDLDHFKAVNDVHGHAGGDVVLVEVSRRMREALRPGDVLARLGGDEFAVILQDCSDPVRAGQRLCEAVIDPILLNEGVVLPSISVGATTIDPREHDRTALLHEADLALYRAKDSGRAQVSA